jgi:hypothetical protein
MYLQGVEVYGWKKNIRQINALVNIIMAFKDHGYSD